MTVASLLWKLVYIRFFFSMCNTAQPIPIIYILSRSSIILKLLTNLLAITMPC